MASLVHTNNQQVNASSRGEGHSISKDSGSLFPPRPLFADYYYTNGTPLHWAASKGELNLLHYLLRTGADVNALSEGGETALTWAVKKSQLDAVKLLLDYNADACLAASVDKLAVHRLLFVFAMQFDFANDMQILNLLGSSMTILSVEQRNYIFVRELSSCQPSVRCSLCANGQREYEGCCERKVVRYQQIKNVLDKLVGRTISLRHICRCVIRRSVGTTYLPNAFASLPLPNKLKDYLLLNGC